MPTFRTIFAAAVASIFLLGWDACAQSPVLLRSAAIAFADKRPTKQERTIPSQAQYRKWKKVNPEPALFPGVPATSCMGPTSVSQFPGPHLDKWITVYVNPIGKNEMLKPMIKRFPVGTVIIKEKMASRTSRAPELMTVMRKREKGYDSEGGDWEYLVLDGKTEKVQAQGKLEHCRNCHMEVAQRDHIFRNYYGTAQSRIVPYPSQRFFRNAQKIEAKKSLP